MTASADRLVAAGPRVRELWLTVGLSVLLHGLLTVAVVWIPRFHVGSYMTVPVSYQVNLVSAAPGGRAGGSAQAPKAVTPPPAPQAPPVSAPRAIATPRVAAGPSEELTLPGKRPVKQTPAEVEPFLRPPSVTGRDTLRRAPAETRPQVSTGPVPSPTVASTGPATVAAAPTATGVGKGSGIELAGGEKGDDAGGSALGYYLGLVDFKISGNWVPIGTGVARDRVVVVRFRVLRSGAVRDVELETSSGDAGMDNAALRAVRQSVPLPPFPNLLTEPSLNLRYRFVMELG
jgi:protein TonB